MSEDQFIPFHSTDLTGKRLLVLAPHPDDETIGCGGSLVLHKEAHDPVKVIFLTNGAKGDMFKLDSFLSCTWVHFNIAVILSVFFKLWLVSAQNLTAMGGAVYDDRLFLTLAKSLLNGSWLGAYDHVTLVKGPFYPMWIAAMSQGGIPLLFAQHLLYILACSLLVIALNPLLARPLTAFLIFVVLLFNPMSYMSGVMTQVVREGIYPALTMFVFACAIGLLLRCEGSFVSLLAWAASLGLALSVLWLTREEGIWVVPSMMLIIAAVGISLFRGKSSALQMVLLLGIPLMVVLLVIGGVVCVNKNLYDIGVVTELKSPDFLAAYGSLTRVQHTKWKPTVPVPQDVSERLYRVSPAFAELKPFLTGESANRYMFKGIRELCSNDATVARKIDMYLEEDASGLWREILLDDNKKDIHGGWFMWAFRDAVAAAGYYKSGKTTAAYYRRLAGEVNEACSDGRLECGPERASLIPPWHRAYAILLLKTAASGILSVARFKGFDIEPFPSLGDEKSLEIFRKITKEKIAAPEFRIKGWVFSPTRPVTLSILTSKGVSVGPQILLMPSPDVYGCFLSGGKDIPNAQEARFDIGGALVGEFSACKTDCYLHIEDGSDVGKNIPLDGSILSIDEDALYLRFESLAPAGTETSKRDQLKLGILRWVGVLYQKAITFMNIAGFIGYWILTVRFVRKQLPLIYWTVVTALLVAILSRVMLLSLIQVTSFIAIIPQYLSPLYPLVLLYVMLVFAAFLDKKNHL
jgi:hypothetical protein